MLYGGVTCQKEKMILSTLVFRGSAIAFAVSQSALPVFAEPDPTQLSNTFRAVATLECNTLVATADGTLLWYKDCLLDREDGPAYIRPDGLRIWYQKGKWHREGGPAIEFPDGTRMWYRNGKLDREGGPAIERPNGMKQWYRNGEPYRKDGPAVTY
jgi:hypothetical protein